MINLKMMSRCVCVRVCVCGCVGGLHGKSIVYVYICILQKTLQTSVYRQSVTLSCVCVCRRGGAVGRSQTLTKALLPQKMEERGRGRGRERIWTLLQNTMKVEHCLVKFTRRKNGKLFY